MLADSWIQDNLGRCTKSGCCVEILTAVFSQGLAISHLIMSSGWNKGQPAPGIIYHNRAPCHQVSTQQSTAVAADIETCLASKQALQAPEGETAEL